jgi:hypothetical protein
MSRPLPRLYDLLPAYIRYRDAGEGEPLKSVMEALEIPFVALYNDIGALYDNWFIETCEEWLVPYIGELVGVRGLESARRLLPSQRTRVANTLAYRSSKGTLAVVERVARDVTGWPCHLNDFRQTVATVPAVENPIVERGRSADLRRPDDLGRLGGPFNVITHTLDLRPAAAADPPVDDPGGFHPLHLGLAFWRLESYPVSGGTPRSRELPGEPPGARRAFTFNPFGLEAPLFNLPQTADGAVYLSAERNLPVTLRTLPLAEEIAALRAGRPVADGFFGVGPAFRILEGVEGKSDLRLVPPEEMEICDLAQGLGGSEGEARVRVDPVRGRFLFRDGDPERDVRVDYCYGSSMDLGGGPYPRPPGLAAPVPITWKAVVARGCERRYDPIQGVRYFPSLTEALDAWNLGRRLPIPPPRMTSSVPQGGVIRIADSATYEVRSRVHLEGRCLVLQAADGCCPLLRGDTLDLIGSRPRVIDASIPSAVRSDDPLRQNELYLQGLWIEAGIRLLGGGALFLEHCTVDPPRPGQPLPRAIRFEGAQEGEASGRSVVKAHRCILGALDLGDRPTDVELTDCIVDAGEGGVAISGTHVALQIARCTVFGEARLHRLPSAAGVLFTGPVRVALASEGEVRFSYLPAGCALPTQDRCVGPGAAPAGEPQAAEVVPAFTSTIYGDPGYAQLSPGASASLRTGGEDGNEIGVYNALRQGDRLASLREALDEFLPWGMQARISFVT